ncbi:YbgC/FadM family acyl-CoA thioesterase [Arcobacter sp. CECT 8985]|uniref:YbgC/FadM family acyl-CoA thioesterase n=1 Tax=Arcobacter sp. CECT 8985 TaxID=1935424 RepID=UPI00100ACFF6|nr:YbgC/FadM family acyl-CoA thioesterase [Arcobacter sp. CECT 8985]RXJ86472.1 acyl-CoA thioester hydrolase [Arcobacter sp. CECT 8985]
MKIRVYYEDTDVGGVVYYANYLKFCERARSELFFDKGLSPHISDNEFFVVKEIQAKYIKPAKFGDILDVTAILDSKKSASLVMYQEVKKDNEVLFTGTFKLAYLKDFKPAKIPQELFKVFQ